jgi:hypothetical protein
MINRKELMDDLIHIFNWAEWHDGVSCCLSLDQVIEIANKYKIKLNLVLGEDLRDYDLSQKTIKLIKINQGFANYTLND